MIPRKLELTNFLSYRETSVLNFAGIHLACISGANGAGKSSILDAITWTLFGRSRSRSDDDLVNRIAAIKGEAAEVRFTFALEDNLYRVQRRKNVGKSGFLELQISTGGDGWKTLSENKIRETQTGIETLLRMNYDTFTNASFLLQGKADEFTTRTPNQRKEILAELLGVTEWEHYRERAVEARKVDEGRSLFLDQRLEEIDRELAEETDRKKALEDAQSRQRNVASKRKLQEKLLAQMRQTSAAADQQEAQVTRLKTSIARIEANLERSRQIFSSRQEEWETQQAIIVEAPAIEAAYAAWQSAVEEAQEWQEQANQYNRLLQEKRPFDLAIAQEKSRLEQQRKQLAEQEQRADEAMARRPELQVDLASREAQLVEINKSLHELSQVEKDFHQTREALQHARSERRLLQQKLDQLQETERQVKQLESEQAAVSKNKTAAEQRLVTLNKELEQIEDRHKAYIEFKAELDAINIQQPLLRKDMNKLRERIDRLNESEQGGECPLCGQALTEQHRHEVIRDLEDEGKVKGDTWRANLARLSKLEQEVPVLEKSLAQKSTLERDRKAQEQRLAQADAKLNEIENRIQQWQSADQNHLLELRRTLSEDMGMANLENQVSLLQKRMEPKGELQKEQQKLQAKIAEDRAQLTVLERLVSEWQSTGHEQLHEISQMLATEDFAHSARSSLAEIQTKIDKLGYDQESHQQADEKKNELQEAEPRLQRLRQAQAAVKPLEDTLTDLKQRIQEQETEQADQGEQLQNAESQLAKLKEGVVDLQQTEDLVFHLREEEVVANRLVGAAEQRLAVLDDLRTQREQVKEEKDGVVQRIQRLKLLEKSCGRGGVQALLIEHALPEIEERANELLERLTGGDMSIYFETQRKLKTRDALSETLDIRISDKDGERPYDNYSGGEQFRVNFAIRIALSQLLANRAGARLQTLIIDEGFGSQDPQGRQRLIEAINTVSDEFACILVITHIDELRDAFPTRIEVTKSFNGSDIKVS